MSKKLDAVIECERSWIEQGEHPALVRRGRAFWSLGGNFMSKKLDAGTEREQRKYFVVCSILFSVILFILLAQGVLAVGVAPSVKDVMLSDSPTTYSIRIFNDDGEQKSLNLEVIGDLSQYITLSKSLIHFEQGQTQQDIDVAINNPPISQLTPGSYVVRVVVKEAVATGQSINTFVGIASRLNIVVPGGSRVSLQPQMYAPNFVKDKENSFSVEVTNNGGIDATDCRAAVDIYTSMNAQIDTLLSDVKPIAKGTTERFILSWTPSADAGTYLAKAKVVCKEQTVDVEQQFTIGSAQIKIVGFASDGFVLGEISKFDLIIGSEWGEIIPGTYAEVDLTKDGKSIYSIKTESRDLAAKGTATLPVFLNTKDVAPGNYVIFVTINYLGKQSESVYNAYLADNRVVLSSLSGKVAGGATSISEPVKNVGSTGSTSLLIVVILVIVIVNVVLVLKIVKKRRKI